MIKILSEFFLPQITLEQVPLFESKAKPQPKENAMKTFRNLSLVGCWLLCWAFFANSQPAQEAGKKMPFEIQGEVTIHGKAVKMKDKYAVQVGAGYATFVLDQLSKADTKLLDTIIDKGVTLKGNLRTVAASGPPILVVDVSELKAEGAGDGSELKGEVHVRGLLTKEVLRGGLLPSEYRGGLAEAYLLNGIPHLQFSPVRITGNVAKKAEGLYGHNVIMRCTLEGIALGSRGQHFKYTLKDVQLDDKK
jgi:hypothetical protein